MSGVAAEPLAVGRFDRSRGRLGQVAPRRPLQPALLGGLQHHHHQLVVVVVVVLGGNSPISGQPNLT